MNNRTESQLSANDLGLLLKARAARFGVNVPEDMAQRAGEIMLEKERRVGRTIKDTKTPPTQTRRSA